MTPAGDGMAVDGGYLELWRLSWCRFEGLKGAMSGNQALVIYSKV